MTRRITSSWGIGAHHGCDIGEHRWIWAFGTKIGVATKFEKTAIPDMLTFSLIRQTKSQVWSFGNNLGLIWPFQIFGYLGIWAKNELWQAPSET